MDKQKSKDETLVIRPNNHLKYMARSIFCVAVWKTVNLRNLHTLTINYQLGL